MQLRRLNALCVPLLLILLLGLVCYYLLPRAHWFPLRRVIMAPQSLPFASAAIQEVAEAELKGDFFAFDVSAFKEKILENPWVRSVSVRRVFPDAVWLAAQAHAPVAVWQDRGLLDRQGVAFYPSDWEAHAPTARLYASSENKDLVFYYFQWLEKAIQSKKLALRRFVLDDDMECHIQFDNGVLVHVSAQYFIPYINRFLALYPRIIGQRAADVVAVDLHYETGLAIQWKKAHSKFKQSLRKI